MPLLRGLRHQYAGRQRMCRACGKIWRLPPATHGGLVGGAVAMLVVGAAVPYLIFKTAQADRWCVSWLAAAVVVVWPLVNFVVWKMKVRR